MLTPAPHPPPSPSPVAVCVGANPKHTVHELLDSIIQSRIDVSIIVYSLLLRSHDKWGGRGEGGPGLLCGPGSEPRLIVGGRAKRTAKIRMICGNKEGGTDIYCRRIHGFGVPSWVGCDSASREAFRPPRPNPLPVPFCPHPPPPSTHTDTYAPRTYVHPPLFNGHPSISLLVAAFWW